MQISLLIAPEIVNVAELSNQRTHASYFVPHVYTKLSTSNTILYLVCPDIELGASLLQPSSPRSEDAKKKHKNTEVILARGILCGYKKYSRTFCK